MDSQQRQRDPIRDIFSNPSLWTKGSSRDKMEAMSKLDSILYSTINNMVKSEPTNLNDNICNSHTPKTVTGNSVPSLINSSETNSQHLFKETNPSNSNAAINNPQIDSNQFATNETGSSSSRRSLAFKKKQSLQKEPQVTSDVNAVIDVYGKSANDHQQGSNSADHFPKNPEESHDEIPRNDDKVSQLEDEKEIQMYTRFSGNSMFIEMGDHSNTVDSGANGASLSAPEPVDENTAYLESVVIENESGNEHFNGLETDVGNDSAITEEQNRLKPVKGTRKYFVKIINGKKFHECSMCTKLFRTRAERKAHNKMHKETIMDVDVKIIDGKKWRECSECFKLFKTRKELRIHFRIHSNEKPYSCEVCGKAFKQIAHMNSHMKIHSGEKPHTCDLCGMNFSERSSLKRHIRRHLGIRPFQCDICEKTFYTSTTLKSHKESHEIRSGTKARYDCTICKKSYSRKETLNKHMKTHDPEQRITCEQCGCYFLTKAHLKRHQLTHKVAEDTNEDYKKFFCGVCEKKFSTDGLLKSHMTTHKTERNFACDQCPCTFKDKYALQRHAYVHNPVEREKKASHLCEQCGKKFLSRSSLRYHLTTHMGSKPFSCEVCSRTFSRERDLIKHVTIHEKDTDFKCPECEETFQLRKQLLLHISRRHPEEEKIHQCKICLKIFSRDDTLKCHMKRHEGTAYQCDICDKIFDRKSNLKVHKLTHTMTSDIQCPYCPMKVRYKRSLVRHIARRHKDVANPEFEELLQDGLAKENSEYQNSLMDEEEKHSLNQYYDEGNTSPSLETENLSNDEDSASVTPYKYTAIDNNDQSEENDSSCSSYPEHDSPIGGSKHSFDDEESSSAVPMDECSSNLSGSRTPIAIDHSDEDEPSVDTQRFSEEDGSSTDDYTDYEDFNDVPEKCI